MSSEELYPDQLVARQAPVVNYIAFGDSFAAAPGAGFINSENPGFKCSQCSGSYPQRFYNSLTGGDLLLESAGRCKAFPELRCISMTAACTGATVEAIQKQIEDHMDGAFEHVTISMGYANDM